MVYKYYYITFPNAAIYNKQECMFQYYIKKYGYLDYFEELPPPEKLSVQNYFVAIPEEIASDLIDILVKYENCRIESME